MSAASDYLEQALLRELFRGTNFAPPSVVYVALHTADPTDAGTGAEVSTTSTAYARLAVNCDGATTPYWTDAASEGGGGHECTNQSELAYAEATAAWGTVTHFGIWTAATGGSLLVHGALTTPRAIEIGDTFRFKAGELKVRFR